MPIWRRFFTLDSMWSLVTWYALAFALCTVALRHVVWLHPSIYSSLSLVFPAYLATRLYRITRDLQAKGYEWVNGWNIAQLVFVSMARIDRLPPFEETGTIPDFRGDANSLIRLMNIEALGAGTIQEIKDDVESGKFPEAMVPDWQTRLILSGWMLSALHVLLNAAVIVASLRDQRAWLGMFLNFFITPAWLTIAAFEARRFLLNGGYPSVSWSLALKSSNAWNRGLWLMPRWEQLQPYLADLPGIADQQIYRSLMTLEQSTKQKAQRSSRWAGKTSWQGSTE